MPNTLEPKAIQELERMRFIIPDYQRGYRWARQQVMDLLEDIDSFRPIKNARMYCIQPLVVKRKDNEDEMWTTWEVIDGQQRLTCIHIILNYLGLKDFYSIEYQRRENSAPFLKNIDGSKKNDNIDFYYMADTFETVSQWFNPKGKKAFKRKLLKYVKFIWYETTEENPVTVFTRLNIGKIPLTNAELIKAMLLNKDNNTGVSTESDQMKLALQWDEIEHSLDNDEFWYFLNNVESAQTPTRIDLIFNLIRENREIFKYAGRTKVGQENKYKTFYYFYDYLDDNKDLASRSEIWNTVLRIYYAFSEWYNDNELYHYVGFLIAVGADELKDILIKWFQCVSRTDFENYLKDEIKKKLGDINWEETFEYNEYNDKHDRKKTECKPLLLYFNVIQIVKENKNYREGSKFKAETHRRFPFHLFKKEKWDVEHIDSATENELDEEKDRQDYLKTSLIALNDFVSDESEESDNNKLIDKICEYLKNGGKNQDKGKNIFDELREKIQSVFGASESRPLSDEDKNKIWNFTLLDSHTNRSYKNSIFPYKRRVILGKSQGLTFEVIGPVANGAETQHFHQIGKSDFYVHDKTGEQAFVPQGTLNVFMKYYSIAPSSLFVWTKSDAEAYRKALQAELDYLK